MKFQQILALTLGVLSGTAAYAQTPVHTASTGNNTENSSAAEQLFVQSVMYRPLADWCEPKLDNIELRSAYRDWYRQHKGEITTGSQVIAEKAQRLDKSMQEMLNALIHIQEVEFSGLEAAQQLEKCETLSAFLAK